MAQNVLLIIKETIYFSDISNIGLIVKQSPILFSIVVISVECNFFNKVTRLTSLERVLFFL